MGRVGRAPLYEKKFVSIFVGAFRQGVHSRACHLLSVPFESGFLSFFLGIAKAKGKRLPMSFCHF